MNSQTDEELVVQIQQGDVLAFEEIVKRYQHRLSSFVFHIVYATHSIEEIVQDTFFAAYKAIDRVDTTKKFSSYLFAIARNTAISYLRKHKNTVPLDKISQAADEETIYEDLIRTEKHHQLHHALHALEEKFRRVITLYYFDDLSYEEISKKLHIPVNTVRTHLFRAKKELKKNLTL